MNYVDYFDAVEMLGYLHGKVSDLINSLEEFYLSSSNDKKLITRSKLLEIKTDVKKKTRLNTSG